MLATGVSMFEFWMSDFKVWTWILVVWDGVTLSLSESYTTNIRQTGNLPLHAH